MESDFEIYFKNSRLSMSFLERIIFRSISYIFYSLLIAFVATVFLSEIYFLFWPALGFFLFLLDRYLHLKKAEKNLLNYKNRLLNSSLFLTSQSFNILETCLDKSLISKESFSLTLLENLIKKSEISDSLSRTETPVKNILSKIISSKEAAKTSKEEIYLDLEKICISSTENALRNKNPFIEISDLFMGILTSKNKKIEEILFFFSLTPEDVNKAIIWNINKNHLRFLKHLPSSVSGFTSRSFSKKPRIMNRAWTARLTPVLDKYSTDLTSLARNESIGLLIGHAKEYDELEDVISKPEKSNAILIGEVGSGKSTIISHLAFKITRDEIAEPLFDHRLVSLEISSLIAGAKEEEIQKRVVDIVKEITEAKNIILVIENIHNLLKSSSPDSISIADTLVPAIASSSFSVIGTTFPQEYKKLIENNSDFSSAFSPITLEKITDQEAAAILVFEGIILENQYKNKLLITIPAINKAVKIANQYFGKIMLPESASKLLKEAAADAYQNREKEVNASSIIKIAERKINIPLHDISISESEKLINLEEIIHKKLINQKEAVSAISSSLRQYRSGLINQEGPIASFLFVGPTGVGKTELSKIIAEIEFGSKKEMIRLDMSEFQDKQSFFRLIGSPDGKIVGSLTEAISEKPFSLVLLDEFEKSHPDILNLFLQVLDDGRLTDNFGRTVSFKNAIIIATSNAHSDWIKEKIDSGKKMEDISQELKKKLTAFFSPELLNRFSKIIAFKNLSPEDIKKITELKLISLFKEIEENKSISIYFKEEIINKISELGFDPVFGARPLNEAINDYLKNPLAEKILREEIKKGDKLEAILKNDKIVFISKNQ
ncbi:MAG: ATP-dependent Clp protease ATP-binding subunit [Candidatus Pacebacteria bacterium]|nr:ATP-dependent Clp protease ATP-binding subunit [Candidatus Paceibacterota bacterium]